MSLALKLHVLAAAVATKAAMARDTANARHLSTWTKRVLDGPVSRKQLLGMWTSG